MTLISRQVNIATTLLNNPQIYKVKDLSQKYGVSTRTLRNDLNKIARWVNTQPGCHLLFFENCSKRFKKNNLQTAAIITSQTGRIGPWNINDGLPTLEEDRYLPV